MGKTLAALINSDDLEAVYIGEHLQSQSEYYISELAKLGLTREQAEAGIESLGKKLLAAVGDAEPLPFPNYRDELIEELYSLGLRKEVA